ncbi:MAG: MFS transporter [Snowella sp.]|nr:MFS transporter [Snowella sp.]
MIFKLKGFSSNASNQISLFLWVWFGQLISNVGTQLTLFALGVVVYQHSQSVTQFAGMTLAIYLPPILLTPLAGYLTDRYPRRWIMILSDTGSMAGILILSGLLQWENTASWQVYGLLGFSSACNSFHVPAYLAATTLMVPKTFLSRANGLVLVSHSLAQLSAPFAAGWLILSLGLPGLVLLDCLSFLFMLIILITVRFPEITNTKPSSSHFSYYLLVNETIKGWQYIRQRPGLLALLLLMGMVYATLGVTEVLFTPLILSFATAKELGFLLSMAGGGWLVGSLIVSLWRNPPSFVLPIIGGIALQGWLLWGVGVDGIVKSFPIFIIGIFSYSLVCPIILGFSQTIWQKQVEVSVQGQVFATRLAIEWSFRLFALGLAGWLADSVFEPFFQGDHWLLDQVAWLLGRGAGRGIAYLLSVMGFLNLLAAIASYRYSPLLKLDRQISH